MSKPKFKVKYEEQIFLAPEFRTQNITLAIPPLNCLQDKIGIQPSVAMGWIREEIYYQWDHQSLQ